MHALLVAGQMGLTIKQAEDYLNGCSDVVEDDQFVAILRGDEVHIAVEVKGLGGRKLLKDCKAVLARWLDREPMLVAPVRHGNDKALRLAEALGFTKYAETRTHIWLRRYRYGTQ